MKSRTFKYLVRCSYHWATGKESINCFGSSKSQPVFQFHSNHLMEEADQLPSISRNLLGEESPQNKKSFLDLDLLWKGQEGLTGM